MSRCCRTLPACCSVLWCKQLACLTGTPLPAPPLPRTDRRSWPASPSVSAAALGCAAFGGGIFVRCWVAEGAQARMHVKTPVEAPCCSHTGCLLAPLRPQITTCSMLATRTERSHASQAVSRPGRVSRGACTVQAVQAAAALRLHSGAPPPSRWFCALSDGLYHSQRLQTVNANASAAGLKRCDAIVAAAARRLTIWAA